MIPILLFEFETGRIIIVIMMLFLAYQIALRFFGIDLMDILP